MDPKKIIYALKINSENRCQKQFFYLILTALGILHFWANRQEVHKWNKKKNVYTKTSQKQSKAINNSVECQIKLSPTSGKSIWKSLSFRVLINYLYSVLFR